MTSFLHILYHDETKFNEALYKFIFEQSEGIGEHHFITPHKMVYDRLVKINSDIEYIPGSCRRLINIYGKNFDWIFIHALNTSKNGVLTIRRKSAKKIIWRVWGHDVLDVPSNTSNFIKNFLKIIQDKLYIRKIQSFYAFGLGFKYDEILLQKRFGKIRKSFLLPYIQSNPDLYNKMETDKRTCEELRVMIGHSGYHKLAHKEIINKLAKFKDKKIKICLVLCYGDEEYIEEVKKHSLTVFSEDKVEIIEEFMPLEQYIEYLSTIDIGIFAMNGSSALSNISNLLHMHKKLYVRKFALMDIALDNENIDHGHIEDIETIKFDEFAKPMTTIEEADMFTKSKTDRNYVENQWKKTIDCLRKENNS